MFGRQPWLCVRGAFHITWNSPHPACCGFARPVTEPWFRRALCSELCTRRALTLSYCACTTLRYSEGAPMRDAVICSPVRTPVGRFGGVFQQLAAHELGAAVVRGLVERAQLPANAVDDVLFAQCYPTMEAPALGR